MGYRDTDWRTGCQSRASRGEVEQGGALRRAAWGRHEGGASRDLHHPPVSPYTHGTPLCQHRESHPRLRALAIGELG